MGSREFIWVCMVFSALAGVWFFWVSRGGLIFSGDSIQYVYMAKQCVAGHLPVTEKWNPLYPILIAIFSKIGNISLEEGARWVNGLCYIANVSLFAALYRKMGGKSVFLMALFLTTFLGYSNYRIQSVSLMAEVLFVTVLLITTHFSLRIYSNREPKYSVGKILILGLIFAHLYFTKYNALPFVLAISIWMFYTTGIGWKNKLMTLIPLGIYILAVCLWSLARQETDQYLTILSSKADYYQNLHTDIVAYGQVFCGFLINSIALFSAKWNLFFPGLVFLLLILGLLLTSIRMLRRDDTKGAQIFFLISLCIAIYVFGYLLATVLTNPQVNYRTMLYPFLLVILLVFYLISSINISRTIREFLLLLPFIYVVTNIYSFTGLAAGGKDNVVLNPLHIQYRNSPTLQWAIWYVGDRQLTGDRIWSDDHKNMGVFFNYSMLQPLPTNVKWAGNKSYFLQGNALNNALEEMVLTWCSRKQGMVILIHDKQYENLYVKSLLEKCNCGVQHFRDGLVIVRN